jgi:tol-pal system protein YbgF
MVVGLCAGCATHDAVRQVSEELKDVCAEVGSVRQSQDDASRQLTEMAADVKEGRAATERVQASVTMTNADVARLTTRLEATEEALKQMKATVAALAAPPPPPPPAPAPAPAADQRSGTAEKAFASGLSSFRSREYGQAILDFLDVVTKYPKHPLAPTAQYFIGESYYLQHDYRQALIEFEKVVDWTSSNPKLPDALVRAGLCHSMLRERARAREAWLRVVREYPDAPAAAEARKLLASTRSSSRR